MATLSAYVSDEEKARCVKISKKLGLSESSIVKQAFKKAEILDVKKVKTIEIERLAFLMRIENNLNRIAEYCNTKKVIDNIVLLSLVEVQDDIKNL